MSVAESIKKSIVGDEESAIIKSGTLVTTRGTAIIAVGLMGVFLALEEFDIEPWSGFSDTKKFAFVLAVGAIWAVVAAADSIARGIATAATAPVVVRLPPGLTATRTVGKDSPGWKVVAIQTGRREDGSDALFLLCKASEVVWVGPDALILH